MGISGYTVCHFLWVSRPAQSAEAQPYRYTATRLEAKFGAKSNYEHPKRPLHPPVLPLIQASHPALAKKILKWPNGQILSPHSAPFPPQPASNENIVIFLHPLLPLWPPKQPLINTLVTNTTRPVLFAATTYTFTLSNPRANHPVLFANKSARQTQHTYPVISALNTVHILRTWP